MRIRLIVPLLLIGLYCPLAFSQSLPVLEQNPTRLRWFQIQTPNFRILYPRGLESEAQRTANTLQTVYAPVSKTLQREPRDISIVLQNQTAISNGFVTLTPRRSEFFTIPPQDYSLLGTNDWINLLAVHEFRHVVQFDKGLTGWSKAVYYVFGGNGLSLLFTLSVPNWFMEGDAVGTETALTPGGRGRIPQFDLAFRTRLLTALPFRYPKAALGSFKDFVPNHYVLGYFMTTHAKRQYGSAMWSHVLNRTFRFPFIPFNFSRSIKKETGRTVEQLYRETVREVDSLWEAQVAGLPVTAADSLPTKQNRVFTNYQYPQFLTDGRVLALKSGLADVPTFVVLDKGAAEKKVFVPGFLAESAMLSVVNDRLVWSEQAYDPRWGQRSYTVIETYDLDTRQHRQLTHRSRLNGVALSPDGTRIVAVRASASNAYNLVILDSQTGEIVRTLPNPENYFYITPRWSQDGTQVVAVRLSRRGKTIAAMDAATGDAQTLMPETDENMAHPVWHGAYVYYNSPYNGIDNIYAVHTETGERYQVTSRKFGAYNPAISPDGRKLAFNDFTPNGHRIVTMPNNPSAWTPLAQVPNRTVTYYQPLVAQENNGDVLNEITKTSYPVRPYRQGMHLLNPYSWSPLISPNGRSLTASLSSQNLLSTALADVGYGYNANERAGSFFARFSYQGFYPVMDAEFETAARNTTIRVRDQRDSNRTLADSWRETSADVGVRLPLTLTRSKYIESISLSAFASITHISDRVIEDINGYRNAMRYSFSYQRLHRRSLRDVNWRWGQTLAVYYRHTLFRGDFDAEQFAVEGNLYFPGLLRHHSLRLRGGYQREMASLYPFSSPLFFPRGHDYRNFRRFCNGAVEYRLPLFDPDWVIGRWFYVQRFKGGLFYDIGRGKNPDERITYQSVGADVTAQFNFMRLPVLLELGVRTIYRINPQGWVVQPLVVNVGF